MAVQKLPQYLRKPFQDFSGGINNLESPLAIQPNQFTTLVNAKVNDRKLLEKASGYTLDGSPFPDDVDSFIRMLVNYKRGTSVDNLVCAALDEGNTNATYKVDMKDSPGTGTYSYIALTTGTSGAFTNGNTAVVGIGTAWSTQLKAGDKIKASSHTDAMYTEISSVTNDTNLVLVAGGYLGATTTTTYKARVVLHKDFIPTALTFNNNLVISNGSEHMMVWNNTTLARITDSDAPKPAFLEAHKSRVFGAKTSGGPSTLYWSAVNDETSWDAAALEPVFANDNGNICAIKSFADSLIVLKDNGNIYQVIGSFDQDAVGEPDFVRKIDGPDNMGGIAGYTARVGDDNKLYFLAETGLYTLDTRMYVQKVSWNIQDTIDSLLLRSTLSSSKSYLYDTKTQWDTGTYSGLMSSSDGTLQNHFGEKAITDAAQTNALPTTLNGLTWTNNDGLIATFIDSSNDCHIAYVDYNDLTKIKYKKWTAADDLYSVEETAITTGGTIRTLSIAVASGGNVLISYGYATTGTWGGGTSAYTAVYGAVERSSGTWGAQTTLLSSAVALPYGILSISLKYSSGTDVVGVANHDTSFASQGLAWVTRTSGTWAASNIDSGLVAFHHRVAFDFSGTTVGIAAIGESGSGPSSYTNTIRVYKSTNSGSSFSSVENFDLSTTSATSELRRSIGGLIPLQVNLNAAGNVISTYIDVATGPAAGGTGAGAIKKRNHTTTTTTTIDSATTCAFKGSYIDASDYEYYYYASGATLAEKFVYNTSTTITNATTSNVISRLGGDRCFDANSSVFVSASFGANANEIIFRRVSFVGTWTGPESSDSTLTAWGTYDVTGQVTGGNTVLHQIALATSSPATSFATITSGSIVSSDATLIFNIPKITITLVAFAQTTIGSVTINYAGAGVDAKIPCGTVFNNEYYLSVAESGESGNSIIILYDKGAAFTEMTPNVTFMVRYKKLLYAGASDTGKIYKLNSGLTANGSTYTMTAITKEDLLGSIELQKEVYKIYVLYEIKSSGTFDFAYRTDNFKSVSGATWISQEVDQTADGFVEIKPRTGLIRSIQMKVTSDDLAADCGIIGLVVIYGFANVR